MILNIQSALETNTISEDSPSLLCFARLHFQLPCDSKAHYLLLLRESVNQTTCINIFISSRLHYSNVSFLFGEYFVCSFSLQRSLNSQTKIQLTLEIITVNTRLANVVYPLNVLQRNLHPHHILFFRIKWNKRPLKRASLHQP